MNTYGDKFRVTTYGESHGPAVGAVIDGCPAGVAIDLEAIDRQLARRRYGAPRQEVDEVEWLSGLKEGITLGTPIAFCIRNKDTRPEDYAPLEHLFRPGHADYTYYKKYGFESASKYGIYYEGMSKDDETPFFMIKVLNNNKLFVILN